MEKQVAEAEQTKGTVWLSPRLSACSQLAVLFNLGNKGTQGIGRHHSGRGEQMAELMLIVSHLLSLSKSVFLLLSICSTVWLSLQLLPC